MKKSEMYKYAQAAVLENPNITTMTKLEIISELMAAESLALFTDKQEEEKKKAVKQA